VFPVAGRSVTSTGGFGVGAASLGPLERGGDGECRMNLGDSRPEGGGVLPVALAEVFGRSCSQLVAHKEKSLKQREVFMNPPSADR